jgi:hypothetical protein
MIWHPTSAARARVRRRFPGHRGFDVILWLLVLAAILNLLRVLSFVREGAFVSLDGGIKLLMVEQLVRGELGAPLRLPAFGAVEELWREGLYPLPGPPFVYEEDGARYVSFPWYFPALVAPFYRLFGFLGLYVVSAGALVATWLRMVWLGRELGWGRSPTALALSVLAFATPLPLYGAAFWEHTIAVACAFFAWSELLAQRARGAWSASRLLIAGAVAGLGQWFRPETGAMTVALVLVSAPIARRHARAWSALVGGALTATVIWMATNQLLYGRPLGFHAVQSLEGGARLAGALRRGAHAWELATDWMAFVWFAPAFLLALTLMPRLRARPEAVPTGSSLILFVTLALFIVPNSGGQQMCARYFLPALPLIAVLAGAFVQATLSARRHVWAWVPAGVLVLLICHAAHENLGERTSALREDYAYRVRPCLDVLAQHPSDALIFDHPFVAADMAAGFGAHPVLTAETPADHDRALAHAARLGVGALWISHRRTVPAGFTLVGQCRAAAVARHVPGPRDEASSRSGSLSASGAARGT